MTTRPHLTAARGLSIDEMRRYQPKKKRGRVVMYRRPSVLAFSNSIALGDAIRAAIVRGEEFASQQGTTVQHVKNGKPLTEHGAQLLGVPWPAAGSQK